uniref:Ubiquitin interaction motif containing 1 n=1 Tax=Crocodylus porosus TaxID=8502 RepID=A0A7M4F6C9_CROPO
NTGAKISSKSSALSPGSVTNCSCLFSRSPVGAHTVLGKGHGATRRCMVVRSTAALRPSGLSSCPFPQAAGDEDVGGMLESSLAMAACVACPLCDQGFPATEIELHAMYCNGATGEDADEDLPVLTRRQRDTKSRAVRVLTHRSSLGLSRSEKCYLCKSLVPRREYERHVDGCLRAAEGALGTRRLRSAKVSTGFPEQCSPPAGDRGVPEGRLLALLELSESKAAGGNAWPCEGDRDGDGDGSWPRGLPCGGLGRGMALAPLGSVCFGLDSPAKALMSLGEAAACLLDLEEPAGTQPGSGLQTKAARRRKRKF